MRRTIALVAIAFAMLLIGSSAEGKDRTDWKDVQRLKPGTEIEVITGTETIDGRLSSVTEKEVRLEARDRIATGLLTLRTVPRTDVRELYKTGKPLERRIPRGQLLLSSVIGAAVGVGVGAAYDSVHPYSDDPGSGKLVFGVLGFFVGPAVTALGRAIYSGTHRQKLIYRAPQSGTTTSSSLSSPGQDEGTAIRADTP
jgi:hypothetical protein